MGVGERSRRLKTYLSWTGALSGAMLLAACGGGGGGVNTPGSAPPPAGAPSPTPAPAPTPSPSPAPTPAPTSSADSAEYRASGAVVVSRAAYAYDRGITGKGVTIAVIDTGINRASPEFAGRISPDSTGFEQRIARCGTCPAETLAPYPIDDRQGHGTEVASIALAARNGAGPQGLAPEATLLALKIVGADLSGQTAGSTGPVPESRDANVALIAPAIRYAVDKGAVVSVLALNGFATGQIAADQRAAMDAVRGADRLVVQSISNFTGEDSFAGQIAENLVGQDRANKDWFLFAVGIDANGVPRSQNGNAGALADRMLAAGGNNVQVVDRDGNVATVTGNSFAAPAVAGAAALLKQYWPQLGGRAISRILLDTARDAGAPGVDAVFGAGILDVENAMRAQAPAASFAAADAVLARFSGLTLGGPFGAGGGLAAAVGTMTVFDRYGRDYRMTGSAAPFRVGGSGLLAGRMLGGVDPVWLRGASPIEARLGLSPDAPVGPWQGARSNRPAVASFSAGRGRTLTLSANVAVAGGATIAASPLRALGLQPVGVASRFDAGGWSFGFVQGTSPDRRMALGTVTLATPLGLAFELSDLAERGQLLGMRGTPGIALAGGRTTLATMSLRRRLARIDWSARATMGRTHADGGSTMLAFARPLLATAFAVEGARPLLGGVATLGLSSPLRVERARADVLAPVAFDLVTGELALARQQVDLAPTAREKDVELGWSRMVAPGAALRLGVAHAFDAGHVAGVSDTAGFVTIAIR